MTPDRVAPPDPRSREFEGDVHLQPLGEWQRFKYRKLFEMILAGSAARGAADDGLLRVDDFLEVLLWRYSPSGSAAAAGPGAEMEAAVRAFFDAVGAPPGGEEGAAAPAALGLDAFLLGMQRLIMERDYDDGLPEAIAGLIDARFNLMCANSAAGAPAPPKGRAAADSVSREEFIREYRISRDWDAARFRDEYALTEAEPSVEGLFAEAKRSLPRTYDAEGAPADADDAEGRISRAEWAAFQRRWFISNDCWDPINVYP